LKTLFLLRYAIMELLQKEQRLQQVVKLVGPDVLPQTQRLILDLCYIFKNAFLQQSAFDKVDAYTSAKKQFLMLKSILKYYEKANELVKKGISVDELKELPIYMEIMRMKTNFTEDDLVNLEQFAGKIENALSELEF